MDTQEFIDLYQVYYSYVNFVMLILLLFIIIISAESDSQDQEIKPWMINPLVQYFGLFVLLTRYIQYVFCNNTCIIVEEYDQCFVVFKN